LQALLCAALAADGSLASDTSDTGASARLNMIVNFTHASTILAKAMTCTFNLPIR